MDPARSHPGHKLQVDFIVADRSSPLNQKLFATSMGAFLPIIPSQDLSGQRVLNKFPTFKRAIELPTWSILQILISYSKEHAWVVNSSGKWVSEWANVKRVCVVAFRDLSWSRQLDEKGLDFHLKLTFLGDWLDHAQKSFGGRFVHAPTYLLVHLFYINDYERTHSLVGMAIRSTDGWTFSFRMQWNFGHS